MFGHCIPVFRHDGCAPGQYGHVFRVAVLSFRAFADPPNNLRHHIRIGDIADDHTVGIGAGRPEGVRVRRGEVDRN